ncbi:hypothetical protein AMTRI_Chr04g179790 [Amborella trichopoda]
MAIARSWPSLSLLLWARVSGLLVAMLVLSWALGFRESFLSPAEESHIYAVLHPLLMVIGFIVLSGEAILVHKASGEWSMSSKKTVHLSLQGVALGLGVFGVWTKFQGFNGWVGNLYSLHSWMGFICLFLFAAQWVVGFLNFWHRGVEGRLVRAVVLPWHIFLGLYTYALAVVTAETGLLEKLTFLQNNHINTNKRSIEALLVNSLGLLLALLCGIIILAAISSPKSRHKHKHNIHLDSVYTK